MPLPIHVTRQQAKASGHQHASSQVGWRPPTSARTRLDTTRRGQGGFCTTLVADPSITGDCFGQERSQSSHPGTRKPHVKTLGPWRALEFNRSRLEGGGRRAGMLGHRLAVQSHAGHGHGGPRYVHDRVARQVRPQGQSKSRSEKTASRPKPLSCQRGEIALKHLFRALTNPGYVANALESAQAAFGSPEPQGLTQPSLLSCMPSRCRAWLGLHGKGHLMHPRSSGMDQISKLNRLRVGVQAPYRLLLMRSFI